HVLHRQERDAALLSDVEEGDNVRMGEAAGDAGLVVEAVDEGLVLWALAGDVEPDGLDGERPLYDRVEGLVHGPHRPEADAFHHLVAPDGGRQLLGESALLVHRTPPYRPVSRPGPRPEPEARKSADGDGREDRL